MRREYNIPPTLEQRTALREAIKEFVSREEYLPPISLKKLKELARKILCEQGSDESYAEWAMVELHNRVWLNVVAAIPYERRILMLPQCLKNSSRCKAEIDEVGLLCHRCESCMIPSIEDKAAELGIMSIVAEGFTSAISLIRNGVVDAVVGVSCLDSLEKAFPLLIENAVAGIAVPLNRAGCTDTDVDKAYLMELLQLKEEHRTELDYNFVKQNIDNWFERDNLKRHFSRQIEQTSDIALDWMAEEGKRLRPYLFAASVMALTEKRELSQQHELIAIAIECFHKASLIHDDIEDNDPMRYGKPTIASRYGNDIAINVGDLLLGEGYRLLAKCGKAELISIISDAHLTLCKGQGMELEWNNNRRGIDMGFAIDIFKAKTAPAFEVSLLLGAICANADNELIAPLKAYSEALGVAYQLKDDLEDFQDDQPIDLRPSAIFADICENCGQSEMINELITSNDIKSLLQSPTYAPYLDHAKVHVKEMMEEYRDKAFESLEGVRNIELKRLLFRTISKAIKLTA